MLTAADAILAELKKPAVAATFSAHALPAEFVQQLTDERQAIADAPDAQDGGNTNGVASTAAIGRLIRGGIEEVTYLDAIMDNTYTRIPETPRAAKKAASAQRRRPTRSPVRACR